MHRRGSTRRLGGARHLALGLSILGALACSRGAGGSWSLVLITIDTCRADALEPYGSNRLGSPIATGLATHGTRFDNAFAQVPLTLPSHASLLTGLYPDQHGVWNNGAYFLKPDALTLAEILRERGYRTAAFVGSWILNRHSGVDQGFTEFADVTSGNGGTSAAGLERRADAVVRDALAWTASKDVAPPYFLWMHLYDPHWPWEPPPTLVPPGTTDRRLRYEAEVAHADRAVGELLRGLRDRGLLRRTLVVLTADHGESLGEHGESTHGYYIYDAVMRVPLVLWGPGLVPRGRVVAEPVELIDVAPTLLSLLGGAPADSMAGRDLSPLLRVRSVEATPVYGVSMAPWMVGDYCPLRSVMLDGWKYIHGPEPELYHLAEDRAESRNLALEEAGRQRLVELRAALEGLRGRVTVSEGLTRQLTAAEEERLRALGYVAGGRAEPVADSDACARDAKHGFRIRQTLHVAKQFSRAGHLDEAAARMREILAVEPEYREAQLSLALVLGMAGKREEALRESRRLAAISEASPYYLYRAWKNIAVLLQHAGQLAQARDAIARAVEVNPRDPEAWVVLGDLATTLGDAAGGRRAYEAARELTPEDLKALGTHEDFGGY
jgi:arylsulfatase A-like enzyme/Flp pilus assembly protein TadD